MKKVLGLLKKKQASTGGVALKERFAASIILGAVGDAMGYKNGSFEFCRNGTKIRKEVESMGGIREINLRKWKISDDTVMHIHTAKALLAAKSLDVDGIMTEMAEEYILSMNDMSGRGPGITCMYGASQLERRRWDQIPFNKSGGGCGGSMRSSCIGLRFAGIENRDLLIAVGIESGRLTHNHPTGYLGSLCAAVFTAYALEDVPVEKWGAMFIEDIIPQAKKYVESCSKRERHDCFDEDSKYFVDHFTMFLKDRNLLLCDSESDSTTTKKKKMEIHTDDFIALENVKQREQYWEKFSYSGWPGASGDDSCIIAYDALLLGNGDYTKTIDYSCFHGGDSDSTGAICMNWFGALYGFTGVDSYMKKNHLEAIEKRTVLEDLSEKLYKQCPLVEDENEKGSEE